MNILTAEDNGKMVYCRCRATQNWQIGEVDMQGGVIRILIKRVTYPLTAFVEVMKSVASGMLTLLRGECMQALLCVSTSKACRFITCGGRMFSLKDYDTFDTNPA